MDSLFYKIQKHSRLSDNPTENVFTEILAFILNRDDSFAHKFIRLLGYSSPIKKCHAYTQVNHPCGTTDIEIKVNEKCLFIIEVKVSSAVDELQLKKYMAIRDENNAKTHVILLTRVWAEVSNEIEKKLYAAIHWEDVYSLAADHKTKDQVNAFLLEQFKNLIENNNMTPSKKITKAMIDHHYDFIESFRKICDAIIYALSPKYSITEPGFDVCKSYIQYCFKFNKINCKISCDADGFSVLIWRAGLKDNTIQKLTKQDFELDKRWLVYCFDVGDDFYAMDSVQQLKKLKELYMSAFRKINEAIG